MFSTDDDNKGVVKASWEDVKNKFHNADPVLTKLIDEVGPSSRHTIYLLYLPYGMLKGDTNSSYLPLKDGGLCKMSDPMVSKSLLKDLSYGMHSSPLGIILDKHIEYFLEYDQQVIPYDIEGPGTVFNKGILLNKKKGRVYTPNGILKATAGARTAFMLPSVNNHAGACRLRASINGDISTPNKLTQHYHLFKEIGKNTDWKLCIAYFSKKWITSLLQDPGWAKIKTYILEHKSYSDSFNANSAYFDIFYSKVQNDFNLRTSSPYLTNTATHLIKVALGVHSGYVPTINSNLLPLAEIQAKMADAFRLKKIPTIMTPHTLTYEKESLPVYYSMQYPTTLQFLTRRNSKVTANQEINAMHDILMKFIERMREGEMLKGTVLADLSENIEFNYFHNHPPKFGNLIQHTSQLGKADSRFMFSTLNKNNDYDFSYEAQFLRGCVQVQPLRRSK